MVCGYGQSRSIPHYLYFSPKVKEGMLGSVADYKPVYRSLVSTDSPQIQTDKLVLTDILHGKQLTENAQSKVHPFTSRLIKDHMAKVSLPKDVQARKFEQSDAYARIIEAQSQNLHQLYLNLLKDRYLEHNASQK